jgi:hypothetical protein
MYPPEALTRKEITPEDLLKTLEKINSEVKGIRRQLALAGVNWLRFPKDTEWDVQVLRLPTKPLTLPPGGKKLIATEKDLISPYGWVFAAYLASNSPYAGILIEFKGPKGRRQYIPCEGGGTIGELYLQGMVGVFTPGAWAVTRYGETVAPEYAAILTPSFFVPYQPEFVYYVINKSTTSPIVVYDLTTTLIAIF